MTDELLLRACLSYGDDDWPEKWRHAGRMLARDPQLARANLYTACVTGEQELVGEILARDPDAAGRKGGPQGWEPLLFVCYGRLPSEKAAENSIAIARMLLDHGASARARFVWGDAYAFTALTGAIGGGELGQPAHPRGRELAELLLERGADPADAQAVYNDMLVGDDDSWLRLLLAHGLGREHRVTWKTERPIGILDFALAHAVRHRHVRRIGCLLEHGADPEQRNPYNGKRAYENAMLAGDVDVAELLVRHGAVRRELTGHDAFVAACMRGDEAAARELLRGEYLDDAEPLVAASGAGKIDAVRVLLDLGIDPDRPGKHEKRALHVASGDGGDAAIVALLLERGADPRSRCYGGTACDWAVVAGRGALARMLAERSRMPHDAARSGHVALLAEVLREDATAATSVDANGNTPLHRLPEDVEAARAVIELLVAHGAELDARNGEGRTPAEVARRRGLDDHAELLAANSAP